MVVVRPAEASDAEACVDLLVRLDDHFTENTYDEAREGLAHHPAWVATDDDEVVGFVLVERRHPASAEITFAAVAPDRHRQGIGKRLVAAAIDAMAADGVVLVEVKTLDASEDYPPYVPTRAFWEGQGFRQVDMIDPLPGWPPGNPSAIYVASLAATR